MTEALILMTAIALASGFFCYGYYMEAAEMQATIENMAAQALKDRNKYEAELSRQARALYQLNNVIHEMRTKEEID